MHLIIYMDVYFLVNVFMDFIMLFIVDKMGIKSSTYLRLSIASIAGGIGSCLAILFTGLPVILRIFFLYILMGWGMIIIAFPYEGKKKFITQIFELYLVAFLLNGLCEFVNYHLNIGQFFEKAAFQSRFGKVSIWNLTMGTGCLIVFFPFLKLLYRCARKERELYMPIEIGYGAKKVYGLGLVDSGNLLTDPVSGCPVLVAEYDFMKELFKEKEFEDSLLKIRYIPFHSIGMENGLLAAIIVNYIKTDGKGRDGHRENVLVGLYPGSLSSQGKYQVILHKDLT